MHREDRGTEPGDWHGEEPQQPPEEHTAGGMQEHVHGVIAGRGQAPELVLEPVGRVDERVVLRRGPRFQPDAAEAGE